MIFLEKKISCAISRYRKKNYFAAPMKWDFFDVSLGALGLQGDDQLMEY
jgi:hypothetical protein